MNRKTYHYDKLLYLFDVKINAVFCALIILCCVYLAVMDKVNRMLLILIVGIAIYSIWNSLVSKSTTEVITIDDDTLSFSSLGTTITYKIKELKKIQIREFPSGGRMYVRINNHGIFHGRYWVQFKKFNDGKELMHQLLDIEYAIHPDTLKARARRVNTKYLELEKNQKKGGKKSVFKRKTSSN